jgi:hypothetical protein
LERGNMSAFLPFMRSHVQLEALRWSELLTKCLKHPRFQKFILN